MACDSNSRPIDLHESIELATPIHQWDPSDESCKVTDESCVAIDKIDENEVESESIEGQVSITMPSSDIVEISQNFYWPLYARPIDWICQEHVTPFSNEIAREACTLRVMDELQSLSFSRSQEDDMMNLSENDTSEVRNFTRSNELHEEKEDWFSQLSGGQKGKVELVRKVFLRSRCPSVLLGANNYLTILIRPRLDQVTHPSPNFPRCFS